MLSITLRQLLGKPPATEVLGTVRGKRPPTEGPDTTKPIEAVGDEA